MTTVEEKLVTIVYDMAMPDSVANAAMKVLITDHNPTWHFCRDWDGLPVCNKTAEWHYCTCRKEIQEINE